MRILLRGNVTLLTPPTSDSKMASENAFKSTHDQIAILDFGSQYSHIIARRIRQLNVYCELHGCLVDVSVLQNAPLKGIILSGGPFSVYEDGSPHMQVGEGCINA